ncbi:MAG: hypothetical protein ACE5OS_12345 [Anaerolineae bacterium]
MNYQEWEQGVPVEITGDRLWRMEVYRLALFAADLAWNDVTKLAQDRRTRGLSDQLYRATGYTATAPDLLTDVPLPEQTQHETRNTQHETRNTQHATRRKENHDLSS